MKYALSFSNKPNNDLLFHLQYSRFKKAIKIQKVYFCLTRLQIQLMFGTIVLILCASALFLLFLFLCICGAGCLGILGIVSPFLRKIIASSHDKPYSEDAEPINNDCFICLEKISNQVVATCNHSFCGQCITDYIRSNQNSSINCPACRKEIIILFRRFEANNVEQKQIKKYISEYNYKYTREPSFWRAVLEFGNTVRHLPLLFSQNGLRYLLTDHRIKYILLLAIYVLSPFDILPEAILGPIGLFDDGIVMAGLLRQVSAVLYGFVREQDRRGA